MSEEDKGTFVQDVAEAQPDAQNMGQFSVSESKPEEQPSEPAEPVKE